MCGLGMASVYGGAADLSGPEQAGAGYRGKSCIWFRFVAAKRNQIQVKPGLVTCGRQVHAGPYTVTGHPHVYQ